MKTKSLKMKTKSLKLKTKPSKLKRKIKKGPKKWWKRTEGEGEMDVRLTLTKDRFLLRKSTVDRRRWWWFWRKEGDEGFSEKEKGQGLFW